MNRTAKDNPTQSQARSLLADIHGAATALIPRRDTIVTWLDAFLVRVGVRGYVAEQADTEDLAALDLFLRELQIPIAAQPAT